MDHVLRILAHSPMQANPSKLIAGRSGNNFRATSCGELTQEVEVAGSGCIRLYLTARVSSFFGGVDGESVQQKGIGV